MDTTLIQQKKNSTTLIQQKKIEFDEELDPIFLEKHLLIFLYELYGFTISVKILGKPLEYISVGLYSNGGDIKKELSKITGTECTYLNNRNTLCSLQPVETLHDLNIFGRMHLGGLQYRGNVIHYNKPDYCCWCD